MIIINKTKVLLLQGTIPEYRVEIYNKLAEKVDLTVVYSYGKLPENAKFNSMFIDTVKFRYKIHKKNICALAKKFDAVVCMFDFSYIYFRLLMLLPHKYKLIYWGIGVSASYNQRYDEDQSLVKYTLNVIEKADAMVFYSEYPIKKYAALGADKEKMFAANNTVPVLQIENREKDSILFVGSLYKQKKIFELLKAYGNAYRENANIYRLIIIGDGTERTEVEQWINENGLTYKIILTGAIYDDRILAPYFSTAIMCISPDQAGLSVLKSMGYGVPYVTYKNAITGGEIFNIHDGVDGVLVDDYDKLKDIIIDAYENKAKYMEFGENAKKYYKENRTVEKMVDGFTDAIKYVMGNDSKGR